MVNDALEINGSLYVAANEGLFVTADGAHFARVREVATRGVTALATDGHALYATSASALWRVRLDRSAPANRTWWRPGGSRSIQGLVVEQNAIWLGSEDRGVIRFDGTTFTPYDRLAGLPTSWVLAITGDGLGGVFAATLRDGAMHVDSSGHWEALEGLPSAWTLSVSRANGEVCVGTERGAACYDESRVAATGPWQPHRRLDPLPDQRVHGLLPVKEGLLAATQWGAVVFEGS
jgi:ligand-binding sensor domain-containing protein